MDIQTVVQYTQDLNVLYVEDSKTLQKIIYKKIQPLFKHIDMVNDGQEALALYEKNTDFYDIILSDLEMPNMDGQEFSKRALGLNFSQKIIILSSIEDFKNIIELINLGVYKFISKPVDDEQLYQVISDVAQQIHIQKLQDQEQKEVTQHNAILQQRENNHRQELQEFQKALDISALISKTDIEGNLTYVNDRFCKLSGYTQEELVGKKHNLLKSGNMPTEIYKSLWNKILKKKTYRGLFENRNKKGDIFYVESFISPILDLDGEIVEFISISHNMTKLVESLNDIKKVQESKEYFFINISHEMKTPLNAILGFTSVLENRLKDNTTALNILQTIHESGSDLQCLIESILDLGKLQDNTLELHPSSFSPTKTLQESIQKYLRKATAKEQQLLSNFDENLPDVLFGDAPRITQLLNTILDNAIKFTPEKGKIKVEVSYEGSSLHYKVKDTGIGIAKEHQHKIFGFEQLDSEFTRSHEGAGLGLTLASKLVALMDGEITLKSIPTKGSCFEVIIPLLIHNA